ncbi:MAG TPA: leucyl/phenylalanyl-tRNA--protein transferase [Alphaproteobacteria bacterium]|nr:leucyl/phenylalanyl-tRNA--protein transferase [Alphaproteobacteria bacterium]
MAELTPELLLRAYAVGVFPMADSRTSAQLYWLDPEERGILPLERFHVPRRLRKTVRQEPFEVHVDRAFAATLDACAEARAERPDSWINDDIRRLYLGLYEMGVGHSVECWQDGELVGGLYGVALGAAFFGESMFSRARDASKVALVHLVARMVAGGFMLLDTQFITKHLAQFGALEIARDEYRRRLSAALRRNAELARELGRDQLLEFLQSTTQTS